MATLTIRNLDDGLKPRLRVRAAQHGQSMEDEACDILRTMLSAKASRADSLFQFIRARIEPLGGVDLDLPLRDPIREPPDLAA